MIVVSDTTAITSLLKIQRAELLQSLFSEVLTLTPWPASCRAGILRCRRSSIQVRRVADRATVAELLRRLNAGEAEAITLAKETTADVLLIDEHDGRAIPEAMGVRCVGLAGALLLARQLGLISSLAQILAELETQANFYLGEDIRTRLLQIAGESPNV